MFDIKFMMQEALNLATKARGKTAPNPMVGAVVVTAQGEIIGRGFHPQAGQPHAEVFAINEAKTKSHDLSQCTLLITLEPCNHTGRTPPCTDLILESKIKHVVIGALDPNTLMQGKSLELLKQKGIEITSGVLQAECEKLIRGFKSVIKNGRPFITLKAATSLDGKIATSTGESQWITQEPARKLARQERSQHDAILVGVGTVLADDPQLNVRDGSTHSLTKIILDSRLMTPPQAKLFSTPGSVIIYCDENYSAERKDLLEKTGALVVPMLNDQQQTPGLLNLKIIFADLARRGVQELMIEGGARVLGAVAREKLFDRVLCFVAPRILGSTSLNVFEGLDVKLLNESIELENMTTRLVGKDIVIEGMRVCSPV
ncbi:MAG: bifunctional diaminohydroxyphosphoribosylaminopyrimidine deaminase/5-amino-6-(5-phosphoribosylamino)uracil reductase RibD [Oligoflexia bacterium]|nr:bifunctional diaminohydroxyphosphoribosylaminopyrimidine deaminase/5-amino-6-(5-phosphoribosylamino)uracil reductase RibD [Oligoflexia bacterium]